MLLFVYNGCLQAEILKNKNKSPLRNISPCVSVPLLDWRDDYKTHRKSAGLCPRYHLHSPANRTEVFHQMSDFCFSSAASNEQRMDEIAISKGAAGSPPRPAEPPAAWPWRWCLLVRGSAAPSLWGVAWHSAVLDGCAPGASSRAPLRCRDSAATAGYAEEGSRRFGCGSKCTQIHANEVIRISLLIGTLLDVRTLMILMFGDKSNQIVSLKTGSCS